MGKIPTTKPIPEWQKPLIVLSLAIELGLAFGFIATATLVAAIK